MKKILFAAILFAGTTFGFAKNNVQNVKSTDIHSVNAESNIIGENLTIYQLNSLEEVQNFLADCKDLVIVTTEMDGETIILSTHESTRPCILETEGGVRVYVISA